MTSVPTVAREARDATGKRKGPDEHCVGASRAVAQFGGLIFSRDASDDAERQLTDNAFTKHYADRFSLRDVRSDDDVSDNGVKTIGG